MIPYSELIRKNLIGESPKEQYENLIKIKRILQIAAYPRKGTPEEGYNAQDIADIIQERFKVEDLEIKE